MEQAQEDNLLGDNNQDNKKELHNREKGRVFRFGVSVAFKEFGLLGENEIEYQEFEE